jgi:iron(III) transport system substrate-binding protein
MKRTALYLVPALILVPALFLGSLTCSKKPKEESGPAAGKLVLYSAGDSVFTKQIIDQFKEETGIEVDVASDTETTRGVALRMKITQEKDEPRADVYWNNELVNTILLKQAGLLEPYKSSSAKDILDPYVDPEGYWTAFGGRCRVFIVNREKVKPEETPKSYKDMMLAKWRGKVGIAKPQGGTTATHAAALFELWGDESAKWFYAELKEKGVVQCEGNGDVMSKVSQGELYWGWTDTNDCNVAISKGKPVKVVYPDQGEGEDQDGTLMIPHSVCMVKGGPNRDNAMKFIDFLLRKETEKQLAAGLSVQIPLREGVAWPKEAEKHFIMDIKKIKTFNHKINWNKVAERLPEVIRYLNENFVE